MKRFVLQQNIARFQALLETEKNPTLRRTLVGLLSSARRELAAFSALQLGIESFPCDGHPGPRLSDADGAVLSRFQHELENSPDCCLLLHPGPGLNIIEISKAYAKATLIDPSRVGGERLFDVFPDNPGDPLADGVSNLFTSLRAAAETRRPHAMAIQRYDIRDSDGSFVERYWRPVNTPVFSQSGRLVYLLHRVEDVTGAVLMRSRERRVEVATAHAAAA